jgi:FKBP-type peptidyl-prolyl cis-trans isomerase
MASKSIDRMKLVSLVLMLALVAACGGGGGETGPEYPEDLVFAASLGIDLHSPTMVRLTSGVYYETRVAGTTGRVQATDRVTGPFKGYLPDGYMFTSGQFNGQLLSGLIAGLSEGIVGMQRGETRVIVIPSALAYGQFPPEGLGVPKNSVLVFEVTVTSYTA